LTINLLVVAYCANASAAPIAAAFLEHRPVELGSDNSRMKLGGELFPVIVHNLSFFGVIILIVRNDIWPIER
jgi:hypothetical protein